MSVRRISVVASEANAQINWTDAQLASIEA
jgi:hypothetical protein